MKECLEDLCEYCPEPRNDEEKALQEEEDKTYVRGRIALVLSFQFFNRNRALTDIPVSLRTILVARA